MILHQQKMLNSSSSSSSASASSSSLIPSNHLPKPLINASSSSYHPISSNHLHHPPAIHPTPLTPLPHYHHLHAYPSLNSTHHLHHHAYPSIDSMHCLPQASITNNCMINISNSGNVNERFTSHTHTIDPHCQASINANIGKSVLTTTGLVRDSIGNHNYSVDPHCYTTDCSPRSVIRHVLSSSSAPSPDPCRPSCYYKNSSTNAGTSPSTTSPHQATNLPMTRPHHPTIHETSRGDILPVHSQSAALAHRHLPPPWSSPTDMHHHYCGVCTNSKTPSTYSGHMNHEAETEEGNKGGEMRKSHKLLERGGSRSADLHKQRGIGQFKSCYFSDSAVENKPCMIESSDRVGYGSIEQPKQTAAALRTERGNFNVNVNKCTATKTMYNSIPNSMQIDHGHKLHMERSFSCDLHSAKYGDRCTNFCATLRQCTGGTKQDGSVLYNVNELAPKSPDALLNDVDGLASNDSDGNAKGRAQLGSKWEDAEKWVRPANYHYASGCRGFTNLGLLKMSNCTNAGTAIKSHYIHCGNTQYVPPAILSSDCTSNYSSDCTTTNFANYRSNRSFHNSNSARLSAHQERIINQPSLARQIVHVDCFNPYLTSSNPNLTCAKTFPPSPQLATDQQIKEQLSKQRTGNEKDYQYLQENYIEKARQKQYASSDSGPSMASKLAWDNYNVPYCGLGSDQLEIKASNTVASCPSGWNVLPLPQYHCTSHQLTDRFASGEVLMSRATPQEVVYARHKSDELMRPRSKVISMVSLKEVGTQMSSVDGSGSISRFTSKSGSPRKPISPARHNTPSHMRSLNGSINSINNIKVGGKQAIDLVELVECHRAKLELQALSEGERIHSFHRTTSHWSSREMEEEDLSRSLRHSTELDENNNTKNHPWPTSQSYSWKKDEDSKLAKLQLKEARIQAWEAKKKSKADAQLKKLEEKLAKRRSQTTNRIMGSLGAAQKKAEEMRASVYAEQKRASKKAHRFRHRSLSPLSRCTCFSPL